MPEGYTHIRIARKAAELAGYTPADEGVFATGANGPDTLFCYKIWRSPAARGIDLPTLGNIMHRSRTGEFLCALVTGAQSPYERDFALGFLTHYAADTLVHPYVYAVMAQGQPYHERKGHGRFEIALDSHLHKLDTGRAWVPVDDSSPRLVGSQKAETVGLLKRCIEQVYGVEVPAEALSDSLAYTRVIRWATPSRTPLRLRRLVFRLAEPFVGGRGFITSHCTPARLKGIRPKDKTRLPQPWVDPFTGEEHDEDILQLLDRAAQVAAAYIIVARQYWEGRITARRLAAVLGSKSYNNGLDSSHADPEGLGKGADERELAILMNKV